jgi:hypothetical protein
VKSVKLKLKVSRPNRRSISLKRQSIETQTPDTASNIPEWSNLDMESPFLPALNGTNVESVRMG